MSTRRYHVNLTTKMYTLTMDFELLIRTIITLHILCILSFFSLIHKQIVIIVFYHYFKMSFLDSDHKEWLANLSAYLHNLERTNPIVIPTPE